MKHYSRISSIREDLNAGHISCVSMVEYYLKNIESQQHLNAFLEVWGDEAIERAKGIDEKVKAGTAGRLAGCVIALKDVLAYKDHRVGSSSKILEGFTSIYSATVVQRLLGEDAIFIGRTNCDEFAMGASNENSAFGPVLNAADHTRVPGGSSGGSAVAIQAKMAHAALGSDTGGSIRQPAAFTGIYGLKPTYGLISRWGLLAYASSFDQVGPMTQSLEDVVLLTEIMAGPDGQDATVYQQAAPKYDMPKAPVKAKFAVMTQALSEDGIDAEVRGMMLSLIGKLEAAGHEVTYFDFPLLDYMVPAYYVLTTAEASSNLSRYSGMLYGKRSESAHDLESTYTLSRTEGFGEEVKRRIMLGTFVLSSDQYDAYYDKAQRVRQVIRTETEKVLAGVDAILLPTTSTPAFKLGEKAANPVAMYMADLLTVQANLAGNPAISIPAGTTKAGLPIGVQLMTGLLEEKALFDLSKLLEETLG
ncbi:MAG: Asp-tRNA(Asn)/Glu-tRNA(Gln) amidotransferase subunit GatA [Bacteroidetes bacterium]|nr:Asp-tRNA(Asn)/Glu-tRNA(Gln) amidotransferase subunit GatA [Bacteroidota bacterium]